MNHRAAALALVLLVSGCGESAAQASHRQAIQEEVALTLRNAKEIDALFRVCETDIGEYLKHPQRPYVKTCLDHRLALNRGVEDLATKKQCLADLVEEEPSCRRWMEADAAETARQKLFSDLVLQNAN